MTSGLTAVDKDSPVTSCFITKTCRGSPDHRVSNYICLTGFCLASLFLIVLALLLGNNVIYGKGQMKSSLEVDTF